MEIINGGITSRMDVTPGGGGGSGCECFGWKNDCGCQGSMYCGTFCKGKNS